MRVFHPHRQWGDQLRQTHRFFGQIRNSILSFQKANFEFVLRFVHLHLKGKIMWRIIFQNFWYKLVALIMAMLLWFHVATDHVYETTRTFPLEIINIPPQLVLAEKLPSQVEVKIRGRGKEHLKLLLAEKKSLKIDAKLFKKGETDYLIKTQQIPIPEGLELEVTGIISPLDLKIKLDDLVGKKVGVKPRITIIPVAGLVQVGELRYSPKEVTVSGPQIWVAGLKEIVTEQKVMDNLGKDIKDQVDLLLPPGYNLHLSTQKINFSVEIQKSADRQISNIPVQLIHPPKYREIFLQPDSISIIITSAESLVNLISSDKITASIDVASIKRRESIKLPVQIDLPSGIRLKRTYPDSIEVQVR